tara:strand:- start:459 stop:566 length:108 start_codon:yes stop_codon:yes gene_type:complete
VGAAAMKQSPSLQTHKLDGSQQLLANVSHQKIMEA